MARRREFFIAITDGRVLSLDLEQRVAYPRRRDDLATNDYWIT